MSPMADWLKVAFWVVVFVAVIALVLAVNEYFHYRWRQEDDVILPLLRLAGR